MSTPPPLPPPLPPQRGRAEPPREHRDPSEWVRSNRGLLIVILILGTVALMLGSVAFSFWRAQNNDIYQLTLARAHAHPVVIEALGTPVEVEKFGPFPVGVSTQSKWDGTWRAMVFMRLEGPKGRGVLNARAEKTTGSWELYWMSFDSGGKSVNLLSEGASDEGRAEWPD